MKKTPTGMERRRAPRRQVLDSFSFFVVVPKKGMHRLRVHDISEIGIGFDFDTEGEPLDVFPVVNGETMDLHFYLNQSFHIPLTMKIVRIEQKGTVRKIGAEFLKQNEKPAKALAALLTVIDQLLEVGIVGPS